MLLWLAALSVALAAADAQHNGRGSVEMCWKTNSDNIVRVFCWLSRSNLAITFEVTSGFLTVVCPKSNKYVCKEVLEAKPSLNKYLDTSDEYTILKTFQMKGCELSRESLACAHGLVGAAGSHKVQLFDVEGKLEAAQFEGLKEVTSIEIFYTETSTSVQYVPYDALSVLPDLQTLTIMRSTMDLTRRTGSTLSKLTTLNLPGNIIKIIPKGAFESAPEIQELFLDSNKIESIDVDAFEGLIKLVYLDLRHNQLSYLPGGVFRHTPSMARLHLSYNKLLDLADDLFVGLNKFQKFFIFSNAEVLKLSNKTFSNLPSLSELSLQMSNIEHVPAELFQNSTNLKIIDLYNNSIKYLPKNIFKGLKLTYLSLEHNKISFLYSDVFLEQTSMTELNLRYNELKSLPNGLFSNTHSLQYIYLDHNSIELLTKSTFEGLYNLKNLSLASNRIKIITQWMFECTSSPETKDCSFSSEAEIDLRHNKIRQLEPPLNNNKNHTIKSRFLMGNNPYTCDCFLYDFIFNYRQRTNISNIIIEEAECAQPSALKGVKLVKWQPEELNCDVDCTTGGVIKHSAKDSNCKCVLNLIQLRLNMSCNHLPSVFPKLPQQIYSTYLKLRNVTNIPSLPPEVKIIDASFANLTDLVSSTKSVVLNLTTNYFTKAPLKLFESNCSVYLSNNPFDCSCEARDSVIALETFKTFIPDYENLTCSNGMYISRIVAIIDDFCTADLSNVVIISISIGIISIIIITCILLAFRYRTELRIMLRRLGLWRGDVLGGELYDAFISYAHQDENFVIEQLLPNLERGNPPLKICIHNRDWVIGDYIPAQIARSVEQSRYTIIVLSSSFVDSVWGRLEYQTALAKDRVIILMLEDLSADRSLDPELRAYFSMKTYVKADDPLVWERLKDAVLRRKRALKNTNANQQLVNTMATTNF